MSHANPLYVIFVDEVMLIAPLEAGDRNYFLNGILQQLQPLSDDRYMHGPAVILHTLAKYSYILHGQDVYWCVDWSPGLIVVGMSAQGNLTWCALRSPIPCFGGRTPTPEDLRSYQEDAENHQSNLVFNAWDAQFEEDVRQWRSFTPGSPQAFEAYQNAFAHVNQLGERMQAKYPDQDSVNRWAEECKRNRETWAGEGIRIAL